MMRKEKEEEEGDEEKSIFIIVIIIIMYTMIEQRDSDRSLSGCSQQTQHHCYQVIRTTRVHQSSRSSRMVSVQEKVIRSRLQLGYSTPTSFINRYANNSVGLYYELCSQFEVCRLVVTDYGLKTGLKGHLKTGALFLQSTACTHLKCTEKVKRLCSDGKRGNVSKVSSFIFGNRKFSLGRLLVSNSTYTYLFSYRGNTMAIVTTMIGVVAVSENGERRGETPNNLFYRNIEQDRREW
ncbi:IQ motif and SEC7 domain-containing protein 1 isoform X2 [Vespula squamosa]|uniref:IQ motif and SEC7 domain-containing protein 1 isoform X2 n=1 Tax=Vespula squamosa TaxID=30214 RepID=A0ABD2A0L9_VESSQ